MTLYKLSIERPVLASVMSIIIVIFGLVSYKRLGVREFPARVKCASLSWHTLRAAIEGKDESVTTEDEHRQD